MHGRRRESYKANSSIANSLKCRKEKKNDKSLVEKRGNRDNKKSEHGEER